VTKKKINKKILTLDNFLNLDASLVVNNVVSR